MHTTNDTRRTRQSKPTVQLTAPRTTDLAGDARATVEAAVFAFAGVIRSR